MPALELLDDLVRAVRERRKIILTAPPGSGKSTALMAELLRSGAAGGRIIMLEPRRAVVRSIAKRIAALLGEEPGGLVGYQTRGDKVWSAGTRFLIVTEGMLVRMLQSDPELKECALVVFDEFHERNLASDLAFALTMDVRGGLREDLLVLVMSATLETDRIAALLENPVILRGNGRLFPVEERYLAPAQALVPGTEEFRRGMAERILAALSEGARGVLAFLPGRREIGWIARLLAGKVPHDCRIYELAGTLDAAAQDAAIAPPAPGERKIVLSTNLAESSLTLEGIDAVVDSMLEKRMIYDPATGFSALEIRTIAQQNAVQRAGRAGRLGPGVVFRMMTRDRFLRLPLAVSPEILECDLAGPALELAAWGASPGQLAFPDPPPEKAWNAARTLLREQGFADRAGGITPKGRSAVQLGTHPRYASLLLAAQKMHCAELGCQLAALLEADIRSPEVDAIEQLRSLSVQGDARFAESLRLFRRMAKVAGEKGIFSTADASSHAGLLLAFAFPESIARRRAVDSCRYVLASGREAGLPEHHELTREEFLAVPRVELAGGVPKIRIAAPISLAMLEQFFPSAFESEETVEFDEAAGRVFVAGRRKLGNIVLEEKRLPGEGREDELTQRLLTELFRRDWRAILPLGNAEEWIARMQYAYRNDPDRYCDWSDERLPEVLTEALTPLARMRNAFARLKELDLRAALENRLDYEVKARLNEEYPAVFRTPAGASHRIDYAGEQPSVSVKLQEVYGVSEHPCVGRFHLPLRLELLNPAGRPVQITSDLPNFWRGTWVLVRKELRQRYPKHDWPEHPESATAALRSIKRRGE
ncbi:MAG: ATP-dependent helicase HrpB [Victivallaceae bacterium]|nr:ATP-dependent helicase HrpB [Victivallaceae bacterium]